MSHEIHREIELRDAAAFKKRANEAFFSDFFRDERADFSAKLYKTFRRDKISFGIFGLSTAEISGKKQQEKGETALLRTVADVWRGNAV